MSYKEMRDNYLKAKTKLSRDIEVMSTEEAKYKFYMCRKNCKFYDSEKKDCIKKRFATECAKKGLKNRD